jgi:hypothetical protein
MKIMTAIVLMAAMGDLDRRLETKVSLDLPKARLSDALDVFRGATGLNFAAIDVGDPEISIVVNDLSVRSALRLILGSRGMTAVFEDGAVVIRNQRGAVPRMVLRIHDVRALQVKLRDFPGPRVELQGRAGVVFG